MINVVGLPAARKTPGIYLSVILGGPGTSAGNAPLAICLLGNMIAADLTGSTLAFTISAGTEQTSGTAAETPLQVFAPDDAKTKFGAGSELHLMASAALAQYPDALLYCCPVAEGGSNTKASATLTFATSATSSGTVRLVINGVSMDVGIVSGDTVTTVATACAQAILNNTDVLPVTADLSAGVLTVTAKNGGTRGNNIKFRAYWVSSTGQLTRIGTSTAGFGMTGTITGSGKLASGATADSIANALANMANSLYDRIAIAHDDSTNGVRLGDHLDTMAGVTSMLWQQGIMATHATPTNTQTLTAAMNRTRVQIVAQEAGEMTTGEIAAQVAAARLAGDGIVGGAITGEASDPACNLDGCLLKTIRVQAIQSDVPTSTEIETLLNYGATVLVPSPNHPGFTQIARSITSKYKNGSSFNYAVLDTSNVTITDHAAKTIRNDLAITFAGLKLGSDAADGGPPSIAGVTTPKLVRARIAKVLFDLESQGIIRDVNDHLPELTVEEDPGTPGRCNTNVPVEPIPGLHLIGGNVRQVS